MINRKEFTKSGASQRYMAREVDRQVG